MSAPAAPFIIDAHSHTGYPNIFYCPEVGARELLRRMDQFSIRYSLNLGSARNLLGASVEEMETARREYEESGGRLFYCGFFDPRRASEDIGVLAKVAGWEGFRGIKIHPSFNRVSADDKRYQAVWEFARDHDLPIVAHTWSASSYNPVQVLSTPDKFEHFAAKFPSVRFVLAHSGGRGEGRREAIRMTKQYANVFMDFGGDIYCRRYFEDLDKEGILGKVLFGTDYPWMDHRSHLTRVYLAHISAEAKQAVFCGTAQAVYKL
jgi:predicted TIM-barrel fold metal-dependent hydrolase